jgi:hypothetical protein
MTELTARQAMDAATSEAQLQDTVIALAKRFGWLVYHSYDSRRSQPGFPDLVLVRGAWVIFAELKTEKGRTSDDQHKWLCRLRGASRMQAVVWRPSDLDLIEVMLSHD